MDKATIQRGQAAQATELAAIVPLILRGAWNILLGTVVTGTSIFPRKNREKPMGFWLEVLGWWKLDYINVASGCD